MIKQSLMFTSPVALSLKYGQLVVKSLCQEDEVTDLDKNVKGRLLRVLFADVKIGKMTRPLEVALSLTTASLVKVFKGDAQKLTLPQMA